MTPEQQRIEQLEGSCHALSLVLLALVEAMPDQSRVWHHVDVALDAGKTALLNRADVTEAELEGYDAQVGAFLAAR